MNGSFLWRCDFCSVWHCFAPQSFVFVCGGKKKKFLEHESNGVN